MIKVEINNDFDLGSEIKSELYKGFTVFIIIILFLSLTSCGGGGGGNGSSNTGNGSPTPVNVAPTVIIQGGNVRYHPNNIDSTDRVKFLAEHSSQAFTLAGLIGSVVNLPPGTNLSYDWSVVSGSATLYVGDSNYIQCQGASCGRMIFAEIDPPATLKLRALADGSELATTTREFVIEDAPPIAVISHSAELFDDVDTGAQMTLSARLSHDPQWRMLGNYQWNLTTKPPGSAAALTEIQGITSKITPDLAGNYTVELTVENADGNQTTAASTTFTAVSPGSSERLLAAVEVHSAGIDQVIQETPSHLVYPYLAFNSVPVILNEKVGRTITLEGVNRQNSDNPPDTLYRYELTENPLNSSAVLKCSDSSSCSGDNSDPDRTLLLDKPGIYRVRHERTNGPFMSAPAFVTLVATNTDTNAAPNLGEAEVSNNPVDCVSKEILLPWAFDPDGDDLFFDFRLSTNNFGNNTGFGWYKYFSALESDTSFYKYTQFRSDTPGDYFITIIASDIEQNCTNNCPRTFSEPLLVALEISGSETVQTGCYTATQSGTFINDVYHNEVTEEPGVTSPTSTSRCQAGSACVNFVVNRALWGF